MSRSVRPRSERRRLRTWTLVLLSLAVAMAGAGVYALRFLNRPITDRAASLVPGTASFYGHAFLEPSIDQRTALRDLLERFDLPRREQALDLLFSLIDDAIEEYGLSYEADVKPWLGDQAATFISPDGGAALIATTDERLTGAFAERLAAERGASLAEARDGETTYRKASDGTASAFAGGFWVVGTQAAVRSVLEVDVSGSSLADAGRFSLVEELPEHRILTVFADPSALGEVLGRARPLDQSFAAAVWLREQAVAIDVAIGAGSGPEGSQVDTSPDGAWFAFGIESFGDTVGSLLAGIAGEAPADDPLEIGGFEEATGLDIEDDVLAWMGGVTGWIEGRGVLDLSAALTIRSLDPGATDRTLEALRILLLSQGIPLERAEADGLEGFSWSVPGVGRDLVVVGGREFRVTFGSRGVGEGVLGSDERFRAASERLDPGLDPLLYVDLGVVRGLVEAFGRFGDDYAAEVRPWLEPLSHLVAGSKLGDGVYTLRLVIGVE